MFQTVGLVACADRRKALDLAVKLSRYIEKRELAVFLEPASGLGKTFIANLKGGCFFIEGERAEV